MKPITYLPLSFSSPFHFCVAGISTFFQNHITSPELPLLTHCTHGHTCPTYRLLLSLALPNFVTAPATIARYRKECDPSHLRSSLSEASKQGPKPQCQGHSALPTETA